MLLRKRAEEMVELMEKTKAELSASDTNLSGEVSIGSGETDAISIIAKTAESLKKRGHQIHYHIYSGDADHITERLDKGLIDFGLLIGSVDLEKYNYMHLPLKDTWGVLMRKDAPLASQPVIHVEDLWDKPLIVSRQVFAKGTLSNLLQIDLSKLNIVATYNLIYNGSHFVKKGLGYAVILDKLINTTGDSNLCFKHYSPGLEAELCIVWK